MSTRRAALRSALKRAIVAAGAEGVIPRRVARGLLVLLWLERA
jgi:hypothetical protein